MISFCKSIKKFRLTFLWVPCTTFSYIMLLMQLCTTIKNNYKIKENRFSIKVVYASNKIFVQFISVKNITKYVKSLHQHGVNLVKIILLVKSMFASVKCEKEASTANNWRLISQDISLMHRSKNTSVHLRHHPPPPSPTITTTHHHKLVEGF